MNMKKISLKGISEILSEKELKYVMGGSGVTGGSGDDGKCIATKSSDGSGLTACFDISSLAAAYAGINGWWCCKCADAINKC